MNSLVYLIPLLPLLGFLINGLGRNFLPKPLVAFVGCSVLLVSFGISAYIFFNLPADQSISVHYFNILQINKLTLPFGFYIDALTSVYLLIITGVGFLIHLYSVQYMHEEDKNQYARYFAYLNLFVFSMLLLVLGENYLITFIGWEGVGLCSYLLIGYWFQHIDYTKAAKKAFIMNRIGDVGFLLALFWLVSKFDSLSYSTIFSNISTLSAFEINAITLLFLLGAVGKSAQIPLYTWLPDAMAGPTPVSALIHAATMVTAGIYLIARSNVLYNLSPSTQHIIVIIGIVTALMTALVAIQQTDIKKVLAYSTVSQLGFMFIALGVGAYTTAVFHVMTHAFFKALLFLGAGAVIYALHHEQDIRKMGGLRKILPITNLTFLVGCLAIAGIPPFSGFFSKDEIIAAAYAKNPIYGILGLVGAALTAFYMFKLYALVFLGNYKNQAHYPLEKVKEAPLMMTIPLIVLAVLSALGGFLNIPAILGGNARLNQYLSAVLKPEALAHLSHQTEYILMICSVLIAIGMGYWAIKKYSTQTAFRTPEGIEKILQNNWYLDKIYNIFIVAPLHFVAQILNDFVEKVIINGIVFGVGNGVRYSSNKIKQFQTGLISNYILWMVLGIVVMVWIWFFDNSLLRLFNKFF